MSEQNVYGVDAPAFGVFAHLFRTDLSAAEPPLLLLAGTCFTISISFDELLPGRHEVARRHVAEDAANFVGIALWPDLSRASELAAPACELGVTK